MGWEIDGAGIASFVRFLRTKLAKEGLGRRPNRRFGFWGARPPG